MRSTTRDILVVIHGSNRGRRVPTGGQFLRRLLNQAPDIGRRLRFHRTGDPFPDLSDTTSVLFWLADPLRQCFPACYAEALAIAGRAASRGVRILNHPDALSRTAKIMQGQHWAAAGLPCARIITVPDRKTLSSAGEALGYPFIFRNEMTHGQNQMCIVSSPAALGTTASTVGYPAAAIEMFDIPGAYADAGHKGLLARFPHKARAIVIGERVLPVHLFFSKSQIVCQTTSFFHREDRPRRRLARRLGFRRRLLSQFIAYDKAYFDNPVIHGDILKSAVRTLGLDIAAVDYSMKPDGGVVLWEANPFFYLPNGSDSVMSAARGAPARVDALFSAMIDEFRKELVVETDNRPSSPEDGSGPGDHILAIA